MGSWDHTLNPSHDRRIVFWSIWSNSLSSGHRSGKKYGTVVPVGDADGVGADDDGDVADVDVVFDDTHPWRYNTFHPGHRHPPRWLLLGSFALLALPRVEGSAYGQTDTEN